MFQLSFLLGVVQRPHLLHLCSGSMRQQYGVSRVHTAKPPINPISRLTMTGYVQSVIAFVLVVSRPSGEPLKNGHNQRPVGNQCARNSRAQHVEPRVSLAPHPGVKATPPGHVCPCPGPKLLNPAVLSLCVLTRGEPCGGGDGPRQTKQQRDHSSDGCVYKI